MCMSPWNQKLCSHMRAVGEAVGEPKVEVLGLAAGLEAAEAEGAGSGPGASEALDLAMG